MARLDPGQRPVLPYLCTWLYEPAQQHVIGLTYHVTGARHGGADEVWNPSRHALRRARMRLTWLPSQ